MGTLREGARDLGLDLRWVHVFVPPGSRAEGTRGAVYLDVGGALAPGVLDTHSDGSLGDSTSDLLARYPDNPHEHLLGEWIRRRDDGQDIRGRVFQPRIVTHTGPDFDAVVSALLLTRLIEDGDLPPWARGLAAYSASVDQGRYRMDLEEGADLRAQLAPVHLAFLMLQHIRPEDVGESAPDRDARDEWHLRTGMHLILAEVRSIQAAGVAWVSGENFLPGRPGVGGWRTPQDDETLARVATYLDEQLTKDHALHEDDRADAATFTRTLPDATLRNEVEVRGVVMGHPPRARLHKYWWRGRGVPYTVTPLADGVRGVPDDTVDGAVRYRRVIASVEGSNRSTDDAPCVRGLGATLERLECAARAREPGRERGGTPRWPDVTNDDPWYDGRDKGHTIIDAPRTGTSLPYATIVRAAREARFWETPVQDVAIVVIEPAAAQQSTHRGAPQWVPGMSRSMGAWLQDSRESHDAPWAGDPGPTAIPGMRGTVTEREFSKAVRTVTRLKVDGSVTLDQVAAWAASIRAGRACARPGDARSGGPAFVLVSYRAAPGSDPGQLRTLEQRILGQGPREHGQTPAGATVWVGSAGAVQRGTDAATFALLTEAVLYVSFLMDTLADTSARIADAIKRPSGEATTHVAAKKVQEDYLYFQARHYQLTFADDALLQDVFHHLRDAMGIEPYHREVADELARLAEYEAQLAAERQAAADERMNTLMVVFSLTGVAQTAMAAIALDAYKTNFIDGWTAFVWIAFWSASAFGAWLWLRHKKRA